MGVIRRLVTVIELQAEKAARGLEKYDRAWKQTARSVTSYANSVESDTNRVIAATQRMAAAVSSAPRIARGGGASVGSGTSASGIGRIKNAPVAKGPRAGGDDLDRAIAAANKQENARAAAQAKAGAQMAGLAAGSKSVTEASAALGTFAKQSDRARASVKDLEAQVSRNRKEMADLRAQALATGDADGTLADRMRGLSVATAQANGKLSDARRELRELDGGFLKAVKSAALGEITVKALGTAFGNLISSAVSGTFHKIGEGIAGATEKAIVFESKFADVKKVLPDNMSVAQVKALEDGLLRLGPAVGVLPTDMAELTANLAQSGIAGDQLLSVAEDASKLGVAFDLSGKEAGHAFASIQAALGTTRGETNSLFDTINELSNGMNSTAVQLVEVEQRVGSVGRAMSLSGETVAALGSALVSTGASSEVAATGVRTFLARLGAGEAATDKQLDAFRKLGLSATETAKALSSGDMQLAEGTIRKVVGAIQGLSNEDRLPVLIEMFGSESIGTIGALATNVELLGTAFEISGNKTKAAGSVQKEFENRSKTTEHQLQRLKASVEVLAIQFGNALLPSITEIANYLNSPEGQEWGRQQVQDLIAGLKSVVGIIKDAWPTLKAFGGAVVSFTEAVGGATIAIGLMGAALLALTGPFIAIPVLAVAAGAALGQAFVEMRERSKESALQIESNMQDIATSLAEGRGKFGVLRDILGEVTKSTDRSTAAWAAWMQQMLGATGALDAFYAKEREGKIRSGQVTEAQARKLAVDADRLAYMQRTKAAKEANDARIVQSKGPASPPKDKAKSSSGGRSGGHKATVMDRQLAAMDPGVRALLTRGGEEDAGGDLKREDNVLDRSVYAKMTGSGGGGTSSPGPGPNVTTNYYDNKQYVTVTVDASSTGPAADNIRSAAQDLGARASNVKFINASAVVSNRNAGGRMG